MHSRIIKINIVVDCSNRNTWVLIFYSEIIIFHNESMKLLNHNCYNKLSVFPSFVKIEWPM